MTGSKIGLVVGGLIMLAVGGGLIWQSTVSSLASGSLRMTGAILCLSSLVLFGAAWWVGSMQPARLRKHGSLPGTARILSLSDTGVTVGGLTMILKADAEVTVLGRPPYRAQFRLPVGRHQIGQVVPGIVVPVLVDPSNPNRIALDDRPDAAVRMATMQAATAPVAPGMAHRPAAEIVRDGERGEGVVVSAKQTGRTAGELAPGASLRSDEADDAVAIVHLRVEAIGRDPFEAVTALRVPDGKHGALVPGRRVPVAYLPADPSGTTTIDWARV